MSEKKYLYKITYPFKKSQNKLLEYGFSFYKDELGEESLYAQPIVLPETGSIFAYLKRAVEKIYTHATTEERQADFKDYEFTEILTEDQKKDYVLTVTDDIKKEFTQAQLCVYTSGEGAWCLFINAPDRVQYYNAKTLEEECKSVIDKLLEYKVIRKARNRIK